jgi:transposase
MSETPLFVGIDVATAQLAIALRPTGERWTVANDDPSITALVTQLQAVHPTLIVLEATGGYHRAVVAALAVAGLPVVVANPRQTRDFAKARGSWPKPMPSRPAPWPTLLTPSGRLPGHSQRLRQRTCRPW